MRKLAEYKFDEEKHEILDYNHQLLLRMTYSDNSVNWFSININLIPQLDTQFTSEAMDAYEYYLEE